MSQYIMRAVDSVTGAVSLWVEPVAPDFDGDNYPGPNAPLWITAMATREVGEGPTGPQGPQGEQGEQGPAGDDGLDGLDGTNGKTVLSGLGPPGGVGVDGDFYIDTNDWDIYGPKAGGVWGSGVSLIGPAFDLNAHLAANPLKLSASAPVEADAANEMGVGNGFTLWARDSSGGSDNYKAVEVSSEHVYIYNPVLRQVETGGFVGRGALKAVNATNSGLIEVLFLDASDDIHAGESGRPWRHEGLVVIPNNAALRARNAADSADVVLLSLDANDRPQLANATVAPPTEGSEITATATRQVSQGAQYVVSNASPLAYAITLSDTGAIAGDMIALICANALTGAITVTNGGAGGGDIGPVGGALPAGAKRAYAFRFDGTDWEYSSSRLIQ